MFLFNAQHESRQFRCTFPLYQYPLIETINIIADTLYSVNSFKTPPSPKESFIKLSTIATQGIFIYKDKIYKQTDGVAMNSPLGSSLANFFLGHKFTICPFIFKKAKNIFRRSLRECVYQTSGLHHFSFDQELAYKPIHKIQTNIICE